MAQKRGKINGMHGKTAVYINRILDGSDELAESILRDLEGYQTIPEINAMTTKMVARLLRSNPGALRKVRSAICDYDINKVSFTGKWQTRESDVGIVNLSEILERAGMDTSPSEAMEYIGVKAQNYRFSLYPPRGVLAILFACPYTRHRVVEDVKLKYPDPDEPMVFPESVGFVGALTPEFITQLVKMCVRESVEALAAQVNTKG